MVATARLKAGSIRAVIDTFAPARWAAATTDRRKNIGDEFPRPARGPGRALAQSRADDHRRRCFRRHYPDQCVQSPHPAIAVARALLLVAVDFLDGVVDVHQRVLVDTCRDRRRCREIGQPPRRDRVELAHMAEGEGSQKRTQRGGCLGAGGVLLHAAVAEDGHVIDGIGPGDHPGHQSGDLQSRIGAVVNRQAETLIGQLAKSGFHRHRNAGTSPAADTRFVSSKIADRPADLWASCIYEMSF